MGKKKYITSILTLCLAVTSLIGFGMTYSWIKRDFAPEFNGTELQVATSGSLAIKMANDPKVYSVVDLNEVLGLGNFTLKQVSSSTGKSDDFFGINYDKSTGASTLKYLQVSNNNYTASSLLNGYIECRFLITCSTDIEDKASKFIFLDSSSDASYIEFPPGETVTPEGQDVRDAIRISITAEGLNKHYLFRRQAYERDGDGVPDYTDVRVHRGANPAKDLDGVRLSDGMNIYNLDDSYNEDAYLDNPNVHEFSDFNGGMLGNDDSSFDNTKTLFSMQTGSRWVRLRIWLEGYDPNTLDTIAGSKVNVKLTFRMNADPLDDEEQQDSGSGQGS